MNGYPPVADDEEEVDNDEELDADGIDDEDIDGEFGDGEFADDDFDDDEPAKVFSYVFPNGQAEHAVIWLVSDDEPDDGYTIEVEPLSGAVKLHNELIDFEDSFEFVPDEAPDVPAG